MNNSSKFVIPGKTGEINPNTFIPCFFASFNAFILSNGGEARGSIILKALLSNVLIVQPNSTFNFFKISKSLLTKADLVRISIVNLFLYGELAIVSKIFLVSLYFPSIGQ